MWSGIFIVLAVIVVVAVLIIIQAQQTPAAVARNGLDQPSGEHHDH
jgi:hypothetical protein